MILINVNIEYRIYGRHIFIKSLIKSLEEDGHLVLLSNNSEIFDVIITMGYNFGHKIREILKKKIERVNNVNIEVIFSYVINI